MEKFGKNQLLKYGWSEGKGLGKNENGIKNALRPKLKFNTAGIGHNESDEFQWWKYIFDKASNNVDIYPQDNFQEISFKAKDKNTNGQTTKCTAVMPQKKLVYGNFIKTCILEEDKLTNSIDTTGSYDLPKSDTKLEDFLTLDDEKLFRACNGRTTHKGARHGLNLSGKLARLEKQEEEISQKMKSLEVLDDTWVCVKNKRKKRKHHDNIDSNKNYKDVVMLQEGVDDIQVDTSELLFDKLDANKMNYKLVSKKSKRKAKRRIQNLTHLLDSSLNLSQMTTTPDNNTKKKCKRKSRNNDNKNHKDDNNDTEIKEQKAKKLKKNKSLDNEEMNNLSFNDDSRSNIIFYNNFKNDEREEKNQSTSASILNRNIRKKKRQKLQKKVTKKLDYLSETLNELKLERKCT